MQETIEYDIDIKRKVH